MIASIISWVMAHQVGILGGLLLVSEGLAILFPGVRGILVGFAKGIKAIGASRPPEEV
jgi:hypothetical protein